MTAPRLVACYFRTPLQPTAWDRMAAVLEHTARRHCPGWRVEVTRIEPGVGNGRAATYVDNVHKLEHWAGIVATAQEGTPILLIDADTVVLRGLDDVWSHPFDLAYTLRDGRGMSYPFNAGVIFLRATERTRAFFGLWLEENRRMLAQPVYHATWRARFGGINQAALGALLEKKVPERLRLELATLRCQEWNCEDSCWPRFNAETRILHVKSGLRRAVFSMGPTGETSRLGPLVKLWKRLDAECRPEVA